MENSPSKMTNEEVAEKIVSLAIKLKPLMEEGSINQCNKIIGNISTLVDFLKNQKIDQRSILINHLTHPNIQVRLTVARALLGIDTDRARRALEEISDSKQSPFALHAGMTLHFLDTGAIKST